MTHPSFHIWNIPNENDWFQCNSSTLFCILGSDFSLHVQFSQHLWGILPCCFFPYFFQRVLALSRGLLSVGCAQKASPGGPPGYLLTRWWNLLMWLCVSTVSPLDEQASHSLKGGAPTPCARNSNQLLWSCSFSDGPQLLTLGEIKIIDWLVNQGVCLSVCLLLYRDRPVQSLHYRWCLTNPPVRIWGRGSPTHLLHIRRRTAPLKAEDHGLKKPTQSPSVVNNKRMISPYPKLLTH